MDKKQILLVGGGGHCKSCIEVIESSDEYSIAGIIDAKDKIGEYILDYKIIGCDDDLNTLRNQFDYALVTVGQIKSSLTRAKIYNKLKTLGYKLPVIIAKSATVSKRSKIESGTIIMHQALVNANSQIGENCIINSKALVEHDCQIGKHCHISTGVKINGSISIGNQCFIGSNSAFVNNVSICDEVIIGIQSLVTKSITEKGIYVGNPIKKINS